MLRDMANMLSDVGVVFMVVDPPKKFPLLGMTRWIDKRVPVIQQTGRWGKDGFVTWTLFHELGHVLNDPRGEMHLEYTTEKKRTSAVEKAANKFALDTLFGDSGLAEFSGLSDDREIADAAGRIGISPGGRRPPNAPEADARLPVRQPALRGPRGHFPRVRNRRFDERGRTDDPA